MFMGELTGALEAVLFASGDPVSAQQLMEIFGIDIESLDELVEALQKSLDERGSGIMVQHVAGGWQLATRQELFNYVEKLTETKEKKLSAAAMETFLAYERISFLALCSSLLSGMSLSEKISSVTTTS